MKIADLLKDKSAWVRKQTLKIHKIAPKTRLASSLSSVEIFVALYYGNVLNFDVADVHSETRDRLIISKGHGAISLYPILADLGFFSKEELEKTSQEGSLLSTIPDPQIPGFETVNGAMGHGLGVACGIALGLKQKKLKQKVFVVSGDGELFAGAVWEAIMFAGHHKLDNVILIIDNNEMCMLDYCKNVIDLRPFKDKFKAFGWKAVFSDGHNASKLRAVLLRLKKDKSKCPKVLFANTKKGKGVSALERDPLCHMKSLSPDEIDKLIGDKD